nr:His-Xaa-Ser system protein HxsD [uncultured Bacteroides sp.]
MDFPIQTIDDKKLKVRVSLKIYNKETLVATLYGLTNLCFIHQEIIDENMIDVFFEPKENEDINVIAKRFCNDLIDQQVRYNTNEQFGKIRDLIVEQAFKPIS